ncbi:hypothetical protein BZG36_04245 [Bifiguratus adelaidae]|uniref:Uncharacterized protein n=1 Tax=Bifiguratus adelaidae TaxID=1938954 RepID=A0A261Y0T8_9FUNG|nr:hypothetical protein BZG36_04245 [Bifiguratus adelaidae]
MTTYGHRTPISQSPRWSPPQSPSQRQRTAVVESVTSQRLDTFVDSIAAKQAGGLHRFLLEHNESVMQPHSAVMSQDVAFYNRLLHDPVLKLVADIGKQGYKYGNAFGDSAEASIADTVGSPTPSRKRLRKTRSLEEIRESDGSNGQGADLPEGSWLKKQRHSRAASSTATISREGSFPTSTSGMASTGAESSSQDSIMSIDGQLSQRDSSTEEMVSDEGPKTLAKTKPEGSSTSHPPSSPKPSLRTTSGTTVTI